MSKAKLSIQDGERILGDTQESLLNLFDVIMLLCLYFLSSRCTLKYLII